MPRALADSVWPQIAALYELLMQVDDNARATYLAAARRVLSLPRQRYLTSRAARLPARR